MIVKRKSMGFEAEAFLVELWTCHCACHLLKNSILWTIKFSALFLVNLPALKWTCFLWADHGSRSSCIRQKGDHSTSCIIFSKRFSPDTLLFVFHSLCIWKFHITVNIGQYKSNSPSTEHSFQVNTVRYNKHNILYPPKIKFKEE